MDKQTPLACATIEHIQPDITQVRFHAYTKLTNVLIEKVVHACRQAGKGATKAIVIFPEHTDFNSQVILKDQSVANGITGDGQVLAIVCQEHGLLPMLQLYLAYYPPRFAVKFCETVEDGLRWLITYTKEQVAA